MATTIAWVVNDTRPLIVGTLANTDITGYTIELHIATSAGVTSTAALTDTANGIFTFTLAAADLPTAGTFAAEIQTDDGSGAIRTYQGLQFIVKDEIA